MKVAIEVKDRKEAEAVKAAMGDPTTRAMVLVVGYLMPLSQRARRRVLSWMANKLEDDLFEERTQ